MPISTNYSSIKSITIDNPKNEKDLDLSDHFPIIINGLNLKIVSYNVQFIHSFLGGSEGKKTYDDKLQAIQNISEYFIKQDADVCCVQELFDSEANSLMEAAMRKKGYVAAERVGAEPFAFFNGGVRTFVKMNFAQELTHNEHIYSHKIDYFIGGDALVNKGVTHTSFKKDGKKYHIFNTHLQAYYTDRDHYAEVTLAQCVEIKKFIEDQKAKGLIGLDDQIVLCGDFNIPKPNKEEQADFLYTKLTRLMGPHFSFLDYEFNPSGPKYTRSLENTYNAKEGKSSDNDVNLDLGLLYNPTNKNISSADSELSDIFCDIQIAISHYITTKATLTTKWLLSTEQTAILAQFNKHVMDLMQGADLIQGQNKNPIDDPTWLATALHLLCGPQSKNAPLKKQDENIQPLDKNQPESEYAPLPAEGVLKNLEQCQERFDTLLSHLNNLHKEIHQKYMEAPNEYEDIFKASLNLKHVLFNEGNKFFKNPPTEESFQHFQSTCHAQLVLAQKGFEDHSSFWDRLSPIVKGVMGLFTALVTVLSVIGIVAVMFDKKAREDYTQTFFSPPASKVLSNLITDYEDDKPLNKV